MEASSDSAIENQSENIEFSIVAAIEGKNNVISAAAESSIENQSENNTIVAAAEGSIVNQSEQREGSVENQNENISIAAAVEVPEDAAKRSLKSVFVSGTRHQKSKLVYLTDEKQLFVKNKELKNGILSYVCRVTGCKSRIHLHPNGDCFYTFGEHNGHPTQDEQYTKCSTHLVHMFAICSLQPLLSK